MGAGKPARRGIEGQKIMWDIIKSILGWAIFLIGFGSLIQCAAAYNDSERENARQECEAMGGTYSKAMNSNRASFDSCALPRR